MRDIVQASTFEQYLRERKTLAKSPPKITLSTPSSHAHMKRALSGAWAFVEQLRFEL